MVVAVDSLAALHPVRVGTAQDQVASTTPCSVGRSVGQQLAHAIDILSQTVIFFDTHPDHIHRFVSKHVNNRLIRIYP